VNVTRLVPHLLFGTLLSAAACSGEEAAVPEADEVALVPIEASPETARATGISRWEVGRDAGGTVFVGYDENGAARAAGELSAKPGGGEIRLREPEQGTARFAGSRLVETELGSAGAVVAERFFADLFPDGSPNTRGVCPGCSRVRTGGHSDGCGSCNSNGRTGEKVYTWYQKVCWELEYDDGWTCEMSLGDEYLEERCNACQ
jgi:hypothetical protein